MLVVGNVQHTHIVVLPSRHIVWSCARECRQLLYSHTMVAAVPYAVLWYRQHIKISSHLSVVGAVSPPRLPSLSTTLYLVFLSGVLRGTCVLHFLGSHTT